MKDHFIFYENGKICCSVFCECGNQEDYDKVKHFFEKLCKVVSHLGYDLKVESYIE